MMEKNTNLNSSSKKQEVLKYAIENHFENWIIKEIRDWEEESRPIEMCYNLMQEGKL